MTALDTAPAPGGRAPSADGPRARRREDGASRAEGWRRRLPLMPAFVFVVICTQIPFLLTIWYSLRSRNLFAPRGRDVRGARGTTSTSPSTRPSAPRR
ncbi:hypothetical protein [Brachybacterium sp. GPGPB12]|uniref:hypothetical protein n=1 Tax=Brachybacterium sp. GPGPB12 TaxID=3023517 RepID=UPI0031346545